MTSQDQTVRLLLIKGVKLRQRIFAMILIWETNCCYGHEMIIYNILCVLIRHFHVHFILKNKCVDFDTNFNEISHWELSFAPLRQNCRYVLCNARKEVGLIYMLKKICSIHEKQVGTNNEAGSLIYAKLQFVAWIEPFLCAWVTVLLAIEVKTEFGLRLYILPRHNKIIWI